MSRSKSGKWEERNIILTVNKEQANVYKKTSSHILVPKRMLGDRLNAFASSTEIILRPSVDNRSVFP